VAPRLRCALLTLAAAGAAGCADDGERTNGERPAAAINVTAAIADGRINVSPREFGAGPIRLIVSNQTGAAQALTFETQGDDSGLTQTTAPINPSGTATLEVDVPEGEYEITAEDSAIRPASVTVGAARPSAQDQLLQP
jgi:hypothetical protein